MHGARARPHFAGSLPAHATSGPRRASSGRRTSDFTSTDEMVGTVRTQLCCGWREKTPAAGWRLTEISGGNAVDAVDPSGRRAAAVEHLGVLGVATPTLSPGFALAVSPWD